MTGRKCIVFGGSGFIGSHLTRKLVEDGNNVTVFTRQPVKNNFPAARIVYGDFMNAAEIDEAVKYNDYVFHLVSLTNPASSDGDPFIDIETNIKMTIHLLQSCVTHGVKRVIFASSGGAIYGHTNQLSLNEMSPIFPVSPYGIAKATIEGYLRYFEAKHGLDYIALRIANAYGEGQFDSKQNHGVIAVFMSQILQSQKVTVMGDGSMVRDYIYVKDIVNFIARMFAGEHQEFIYNIGSGEGTSVNDIVKIIEDVTGKRARIETVTAPDSYVPSVVLDTTRAVHEFGSISDTSMVNGITTTYKSVILG